MATFKPGNKGYVPGALCEPLAQRIELFGEDYGLDNRAVEKAADLFRQYADTPGEYISNILRYPQLTLEEIKLAIDCANGN